MTTFAIKCPHCLRDHTSFTVAGAKGHNPAVKNGWNVVEIFGICNACQFSVCGTVRVNSAKVSIEQLASITLALDMSDAIVIEEWRPTPPSPDVPAHLPEIVARAFSEAEQLRIAGFRGPAGNAYRRALEAALKTVDSALKGTLYARIEKLTSEGMLTANMRDFAHRIRTLGNEASHETPVVEDDEIDNLAIFTKLFLMYQFTLPGMLPPRAAE
jgi:hypothetical protein